MRTRRRKLELQQNRTRSSSMAYAHFWGALNGGQDAHELTISSTTYT
jgi:hypothetical protein